jgi:hypothetical protein
LIFFLLFVLQSLRPEIPSHCPALFASVMNQCWADDANSRPSFSQILAVLDNIDDDVNNWPTIPDKDAK